MTPTDTANGAQIANLDRLAEIKQRADAATEGPWGVDEIARVWAVRDPAGWDAFHVAACHDAVGRATDADEADAAFIAAARTDVTWLLDELARVTSDLESRRQVVAMSDRARLRTIESLLDALGITDDHTEADVKRILDGCDCNAEEGTDHLVWHLAQKLAGVTSERDEAHEHIAKWLDEHPPVDVTHRVESGLTGDLAADMAAYAERLKVRAQAAEAANERVRKVCDEPDDTQWWPVVPYMDPSNDDEVVETRVVDVARVLAALDADPTEGSGS